MGARHAGLRRGQAAAAVFSACPFLAFAVLLALPGLAAADTHYYTFNVQLSRTSISRI
jgi:laccase